MTLEKKCLTMNLQALLRLAVLGCAWAVPGWSFSKRFSNHARIHFSIRAAAFADPRARRFPILWSDVCRLRPQ